MCKYPSLGEITETYLQYLPFNKHTGAVTCFGFEIIPSLLYCQFQVLFVGLFISPGAVILLISNFCNVLVLILFQMCPHQCHFF